MIGIDLSPVQPTTVPRNCDFLVADLTTDLDEFTDGSVDTTFGTGGIVTTTIDIAGMDDIANSLTIQPDGKLVIAGHSYSDALGQYEFAVVRYGTTGALDSTFGTGGIVTTQIGDNDDPFSVGIQVDGVHERGIREGPGKVADRFA